MAIFKRKVIIFSAGRERGPLMAAIFFTCSILFFVHAIQMTDSLDRIPFIVGAASLLLVSSTLVRRVTIFADGLIVAPVGIFRTSKIQLESISAFSLRETRRGVQYVVLDGSSGVHVSISMNLIKESARDSFLERIVHGAVNINPGSADG